MEITKVDPKNEKKNIKKIKRNETNKKWWKKKFNYFEDHHKKSMNGQNGSFSRYRYFLFSDSTKFTSFLLDFTNFLKRIDTADRSSLFSFSKV